MNKNPLDLEPVLLDIGGLDKAPTDRGLTVRPRGDFLVVNVGQNDMYAAIELTSREAADLREALTNKMTLEEQAAEAFKTLFRVINKMGTGEQAVGDALRDAMNHEHRTLIQQWWSVIAKVITDYSKTKWFDARNEDSVKWAKEVAKVESFMRFI